MTSVLSAVIVVERTEPGQEPVRSSLNEPQAHCLRVTFQYLDELLGTIEDILDEPESGTAFPRFASDIPPDQRKAIEDSISAIRSRLLRILEDQRIPGERPVVPASRTIRFTLTAMDIAVEELKPRHMKRFGEVTEAAATELNGITVELHDLIMGLDQSLAGREEE